MADVFISHHTDSAGDVAKQLCAALEAEGVSCWYAQRDADNNAYADSIAQAVEQCKAFVLILNQEAQDSKHVLSEVGMAFKRYSKNEQIQLIPFQIDACSLQNAFNYYLNTINIIPGGTPENLHIAELIERVKRCPGIEPRRMATPNPRQAEESDAPPRLLDADTWDPRHAAEILDADAVARAESECAERDVQAYRAVSSEFGTMLRVLSANQDTPRPQADKTIAGLMNGRPVILRGNGGMGKTSMMLRQAIRWAREGGIAVWLRLDEFDPAQAAPCVGKLLQEAEAGQKILLCLEKPDEGQEALDSLRKAWSTGGADSAHIQLLMAERTNRLEKLTAPNHDCLRDWFDGALVAELRAPETPPARVLKDYASYSITEAPDLRTKILIAATERYVKDGSVNREIRRRVVQEARNQYADVSVVELIYRTLFRLKQSARKTSSIVMDWEEWANGFARLPGNVGAPSKQQWYGANYTPFQWYAGIAVFRLFGYPFTLDLFCRRFNMKPYDLAGWLREWRTVRNVEPVIYKPGPLYDHGAGTLSPKHDVVAELFFLFHTEEYENPVDMALYDYLSFMNEPETEAFLDTIARRDVMRNLDRDWQRRQLGRPNFREYLTYIFKRTQKRELRLSSNGMGNLCLGLLWSNAGERIRWDSEIQEILEAAAPELDESRLTHILYTEWGIILAKANRTAEAEKKFRAVRDIAPKDLQSRTELGRLLARQAGREAEAEQVFREANAIDRKHLQSRVELGRLLVNQRGREKEAEQLFREIIAIDRKNLQARTELGRLLARQAGRKAEAEQLFREIIAIKRSDLQSRTELGRLLARQAGREAEAEQVFREAMSIDLKHLQSRRELANLRIQQGRVQEAEKLYREMLSIEPGNRWAKDGLRRIEQLRKGE